MLQINASIAGHNEKIYCTYRTQHLYNFDSESYLAELNNELEPVSYKRLIAENNNSAFEDVRLFSVGNSLLAFYTYFPFDEDGGWKWEYGVGFGVVDPEFGIIREQVSLRPLSKRIHEKNWVPYVHKNELFMVTDFDPYLRVIKIDSDNKIYGPEELFMSAEKTPGWEYGEIRGGTPLIKNPDSSGNWLYGFVHSYLSNHKGFYRYYYFTAVRYSHTTKIFQYHPEPLSYPDETEDEEYQSLWEYHNKGSLKVIFPIGIMHHDEGVIVSFGKDDICSYTEYYSWDHIQSLFETVS